MTAEHTLKHIAIIMDGNNRWAKKRGILHMGGHQAGVERIRDMLTVCRDNDVQALTLFAFSSENWKRPRREVEALMKLFLSYLDKESPRLAEESIRLRVIGGRERFSDKLLTAIDRAEAITAEGATDLVIAADYGGQWDITQACHALAAQVASGKLAAEAISEQLISENLSTAGLPPLDLLIRTGGEFRISNFLLWQAAYAELFFSPQLWPDFTEADLLAAIEEFYRRQRRFGLTAEQLSGASNA